MTGTSLSWLAPLPEKKYLLLNKFEDSVKEITVFFGDVDSVRTAINQIRRLRQGDRPTSTYATDFRLISYDIPWNDQALIDQFRFGLHSDVNDLILILPKDPKPLTETINQAIRCDNQLLSVDHSDNNKS